MRFWDSSALVPLVVEQRASAEVERWIGEDASVVVWTLSLVEIASALQRLVREGALSERHARQAEDLGFDIFRRAHVVTDVERVKLMASRLLRLHPLRAADALQLAAAELWSDGDPRGKILHCFDQRLAEAALRAGFDVLPEPSAVDA